MPPKKFLRERVAAEKDFGCIISCSKEGSEVVDLSERNGSCLGAAVAAAVGGEGEEGEGEAAVGDALPGFSSPSLPLLPPFSQLRGVRF